MRRDVLRYSGWLGFVLLLGLVLISGCTRAKSSGPPETPVEMTAVSAPTESAGAVSTSTPMSGDDAINATVTALAATAFAEEQTPEGTVVSASATPEPTESAEPEATTASVASATPKATQAQAAAATSSPTGVKMHTVQAGENLFRIALKYGLTYQRLAAYNGIANPNFILVGQVLRIPSDGEPGTPPPTGARVHTVQRGENLFRIALKYGMLYTSLARANNLSYPYTIYPGQRLVIP